LLGAVDVSRKERERTLIVLLIEKEGASGVEVLAIGVEVWDEN
jgi:hypothetical protein